jgi:hypothetical protein
MKINLFTTKKVALFCTAVCAAMFAFTDHAGAFTLNFNDSLNLGWVNPGDAVGSAQEAVYVNTLISFAQGSGLHSGINGHDYFRLNTSCGTCPAAVFSSTDNSGSNTVNLGVGGFTYLLGEYQKPNGVSRSVIWKIQGLTGVITIPDYYSQCALSHWTLFGPGNGVPDGGTTVMLLGMAFGALGIARRFLRI